MTMPFQATDILGVRISAIDMPMAIQRIEEWIATDDRQYVEICTVDTIMQCQDDPRMMEIVNNAGMATPDGMPLVWLSHKAGRKHVSRVYGPGLMLELAARSATTGHRHFFYGGMPGVADDLAATLTERYPGLQVAGAHTPPMQQKGDIENEETIRKINESNADIVWCGLGTPKQDYWVVNHRALLNAPVLIAVGAAFDFHTGRVRRAPEWMQRSGLEWLFRLSQDPKRLWKRYLVGNSRFVIAIARNWRKVTPE